MIVLSSVVFIWEFYASFFLLVDLPPEQEQHAPDQTISLPVGDEEMNGGEVDNPEDNGEIVEEEDPSCEVIDEVPNISQAVVVESNVITAQEEAPKKSYAAIVSVQFEYIVITSFT